jgi:hypothetical protein
VERKITFAQPSLDPQDKSRRFGLRIGLFQCIAPTSLDLPWPLNRTYREPISRALRLPPMPKIVADPPPRPCYHLFFELGSRYLNNLVLISFRLTRVRA